jgi:hypothetical protein
MLQVVMAAVVFQAVAVAVEQFRALALLQVATVVAV